MDGHGNGKGIGIGLGMWEKVRGKTSSQRLPIPCRELALTWTQRHIYCLCCTVDDKCKEYRLN